MNIDSTDRLEKQFYTQSVLAVARSLIGMSLVRQGQDDLKKYIITEVEAYNGPEDQASHARMGKTKRNQVMFEPGGFVYVYLIYGLHWMLNITTGKGQEPGAVLIRGLDEVKGPGRLTKQLLVDRSFYGEDLTSSKRIWVEQAKVDRKYKIQTTPRIGIEYADPFWKLKEWRFVLVDT